MKTPTLVAVVAAVAVLGFQSKAAIIELSVETPIAGVTVPTMHPYLAVGDVAKMTVRYDTETAATYSSSGVSYYGDAIKYFQFDLSRAGSLLYSGSASGSFGRVSVSNGTGADLMIFDLFTDSLRYPFHSIYPKGSEMPFLSPDYDTNLVKGGLEYGDLGFDYFKLNFFADPSLFADTSLPDIDDFGTSPFAPKNGNSPWSGNAIFRDLLALNVHSRPTDFSGSFGPGTYRDSSPYPVTYTVREYTPSSSGNSTVPDSGSSLLILSLSLASVLVVRSRLKLA